MIAPHSGHREPERACIFTFAVAYVRSFRILGLRMRLGSAGHRMWYGMSAL